MRVAVDLTALMPERTGVDRCLLELARTLPGVDSSIHYTLLVNAEDAGEVAAAGAPNARVCAWSLRSRAVRLAFQQTGLPLLSYAEEFDVIHSPSFLMPYWRGRARHLLTVHDMTFFSHPQCHNRLHRSGAFRRAMFIGMRRAHMLNVPSQATCDEVLRWTPFVARHRVRVTPWGINPRFTPAPAHEVERHRARLKLPARYILSLGTLEPRKNLATLIKCFRRLSSSQAGSGVALVLAGRTGWDVEDVQRMADAPDLRGRIHLAGYIPEDDLPWVYRGASILAYPSLYEGFGFPPLEAMACGVPVVSSLGSSLEENLGGAAELAPPTDAAAIEKALATVLTDVPRRDQLIRLGLERARAFRWERTAAQIVSCYRELAGRHFLARSCQPTS